MLYVVKDRYNLLISFSRSFFDRLSFEKLKFNNFMLLLFIFFLKMFPWWYKFLWNFLTEVLTFVSMKIGKLYILVCTYMKHWWLLKVGKIHLLWNCMSPFWKFNSHWANSKTVLRNSNYDEYLSLLSILKHLMELNSSTLERCFLTSGTHHLICEVFVRADGKIHR